jgi:hypothetical protein
MLILDVRREHHAPRRNDSRTAVERTFEDIRDIAKITAVVTVSRKAFLRIAHRHFAALGP